MVGNMVKRHHGLGRFLGFIEPRGRGHRRIPNVLGVGLGGMVAIITGQSKHVVRVVEEHTTMGPIVWLLLLVGSVSLGIAVWMMDSIAQRMGPPYCD